MHYQNEWRDIYAIVIGYGLVLIEDQDTAAQVAALKTAGCERIFREKAPEGVGTGPELHRSINFERRCSGGLETRLAVPLSS
jgi:hypothetical protein